MIQLNSKGLRSGLCHMKSSREKYSNQWVTGRIRMRDELAVCDPNHRLYIKHYWLARLNRAALIKQRLNRYIDQLS
jgi:hypothetical protein